MRRSDPRRYCLRASWNFVKHFRQEVSVREKSAGLMPCDGRSLRCAPQYSRPRAHSPIEADPWRLSRVLLLTLLPENTAADGAGLCLFLRSSTGRVVGCWPDGCPTR